MQDRFQLFVAIIDDFWSYLCDIRFIQQEPVSMLAFEDLEVFIEERSIGLKLFFRGYLSLAVIGCV